MPNPKVRLLTLFEPLTKEAIWRKFKATVFLLVQESFPPSTVTVSLLSIRLFKWFLAVWLPCPLLVALISTSPVSFILYFNFPSLSIYKLNPVIEFNSEINCCE